MISLIFKVELVRGIFLKATVIFHSVSGNTYLLAREIYEKLSQAGVETELYRVKDDDLEELSNEFPLIKEYCDEITKLPVINLEAVVNSDYIFMGSPTYFGNVSSELKAFMDSFAPVWGEAKLFGKKLIAFSTCGTPEGGGDMCLNAINIFGQHMGMQSVSIPSNLVPGISIPAYGLLHYTGDAGDNRIGENMKKIVDSLVKLLLKKGV